MMNPYRGTGTYWNADGTPDINGGPVDGMIRTTNDMAWLKAMMAEGYKFYPQQGISYFSAILLIAVKRLRKFFSVSMFSSRWALSRMYLPFSSPRRL